MPFAAWLCLSVGRCVCCLCVCGGGGHRHMLTTTHVLPMSLIALLVVVLLYHAGPGRQGVEHDPCACSTAGWGEDGM